LIAAGNFLVMAAVLRRAASMAAWHLDRWEIIDYASDDKPDVPSGTSRELAETLAQVREPVVTVPLADLHGPAEARGAQVAGTRIRSVRLPSFVVTAEVVLGGPGERLIMRHDPGMTPAPYVSGTCWPYARWPTWQGCAGDWTHCCSRSLRQTPARKKRELPCHPSHQARPGTGQPWPRACRIPGSAPVAMGRRHAPVGRADRQIRPAAFEWAWC